ncbi:MAG TPA: hypothetical protein VHA54_07965 [Solirubrobacterales bacterium]|nr:hypothetical protein [Solirubrobacterales bacterium]
MSAIQQTRAKLDEGARADKADSSHPRAVVALRHGKPVELQLLYPDLGLEEPLRTAARGYDLEPQALVAAAKAALALPDRTLSLEIGAPFSV